MHEAIDLLRAQSEAQTTVWLLSENNTGLPGETGATLAYSGFLVPHWQGSGLAGMGRNHPFC
jgi:hypothetical protein